MRFFAVLVLACAGAVFMTACDRVASGPAIAVFPSATQDLGSFSASRTAKAPEALFYITNRTQRKLRILSTRSSCNCVATVPDRKALAPGETTRLQLRAKLSSVPGLHRQIVFVSTDVQTDPIVPLTIIWKEVREWQVIPQLVMASELGDNETRDRHIDVFAESETAPLNVDAESLLPGLVSVRSIESLSEDEDGQRHWRVCLVLRAGSELVSEGVVRVKVRKNDGSVENSDVQISLRKAQRFTAEPPSLALLAKDKWQLVRVGALDGSHPQISDIECPDFVTAGLNGPSSSEREEDDIVLNVKMKPNVIEGKVYCGLIRLRFQGCETLLTIPVLGQTLTKGATDGHE